MPDRPLPPRQEEVLLLIESRAVPPTVRDLCRELGMRSTNSVHQHLRALERKGAIERSPNAARAIRSTRKQSTDLRAVIALGGTVTPSGRVTWVADLN